MGVPVAISMTMSVLMLTELSLCKSMRTNSAEMKGGKPLKLHLSKRMLEHVL